MNDDSLVSTGLFKGERWTRKWNTYRVCNSDNDSMSPADSIPVKPMLANVLELNN